MGLEESNVWLICGDAFEQIKLIPSESIDLILTDPPYDNKFGFTILLASDRWLEKELKL
ncbi:MAG: hypothetical protein QXU74_04070 [Candidatus Aenigmatarchaeota archaeon]